MAQVSVEVPPVLVGALRETAVLLYQATAEALHSTLRAHVERRGSLDEIHQHRARLAELDSLLGQLGWSAARAERAVELSAAGELLHDALHGALIDAGERLAVACAGRWSGELGAEAVHAACKEVIALDGLLRGLEDSDGE